MLNDTRTRPLALLFPNQYNSEWVLQLFSSNTACPVTVLQVAPAWVLQHATKLVNLGALHLQVAPAWVLQRAGGGLDSNAGCLQVAPAWVLQLHSGSDLRDKSAFKSLPRGCCNPPSPTSRSRGSSFKSLPRGCCNSKAAQRNDLCTGYYVHLNLFECIACFDAQSLTATVSILGREVAPKMVRTQQNFLFATCSH